MHTKSIVHLLTIGSLLLWGACATTQKALKTPKKEAVKSAQPSFEVEQSSGATVGKSTCSKESPELCNGLDDNCNNVIDENCGYKSGPIQITLSWNTGADIDLYVTDPNGETIFYNQQHRRTTSGGIMDHDGRGDCRAEQDYPRIENVYWQNPPPPGEYRVELNYFGPCGDAAETETTLAIVIEGISAGVFHYTLEPEERVTAVILRVK
jgi:hypothetical protein